MKLHFTNRDEIVKIDCLDEYEKKRKSEMEKSIGLKFELNRCFVKQILAKELSINTHDINFKYSINGKPTLEYEVYFNWSHSSRYNCIVIDSEVEVGVDIEEVEDRKNVLSISKRFFRKEEYHRIESLNTPKKQAIEFYKIWTTKEAFVKMLGLGIAKTGLKNIEINFECKTIGYNNSVYYYKQWITEEFIVTICSSTLIESIQVSGFNMPI